MNRLSVLLITLLTGCNSVTVPDIPVRTAKVRLPVALTPVDAPKKVALKPKVQLPVVEQKQQVAAPQQLFTRPKMVSKEYGM